MARTIASIAREKRRADARAHKSKTWSWSDIPPLATLWALFLTSLMKWWDDVEIIDWQQRRFIEEYWPAFRDFLLWIPGVRYLWQHFGRRACFEYDASARTPLLELPDELLLMVVEQLKPPCRNGRCTEHGEQHKTFVSLAKTNRRVRTLMGSYLYRDVALVNGWSRMSRGLRTIAESPHIQPHVKTFKMAPQLWIWTAKMPIPALAPKLVCLLPRLENLHTLHLIVPGEYYRNRGTTWRTAHKLRIEMQKTPIRLPSVRSLVLGPHMGFLISFCPNVEAIATTWGVKEIPDRESFDRDKWEISPRISALIHLAGTAAQLRHFELWEDWESAHLRAVYDSMPGLQSLTMTGGVLYETPEQLLPTLKGFRNLRTLVLPAVSSLNVGLPPGGFCGNPYLGPGGRKRLERDRRRWDNEELQFARPVAELVLRQMPGLERLWVGESRLFTPVHGSDGMFKKVRYERQYRPRANTLED